MSKSRFKIAMLLMVLTLALSTWLVEKALTTGKRRVPRSHEPRLVVISDLADFNSKTPGAALGVARMAFANPALSREAILPLFRNIIDQFPDTSEAEAATQTIEILETMIAEDSHHGNLHKSYENASERRIADWIFELRDQRGQQISQPGSCDIFGDLRGKDSPAFRLFEARHAAVPQLIKSIRNERFTRCVGYWRIEKPSSFYVLRIGDCACLILEKIADRQFIRTKGRSIFDNENEVSEVEAEILMWWRSLEHSE